VKEVERVARDPVYWVRREASFALGALAKVVPQEIVICSLVSLGYHPAHRSGLTCSTLPIASIV
jgi:hypothetical protein